MMLGDSLDLWGGGFGGSSNGVWPTSRHSGRSWGSGGWGGWVFRAGLCNGGLYLADARNAQAAEGNRQRGLWSQRGKGGVTNRMAGGDDMTVSSLTRHSERKGETG